jgi:TolB-like protein/class 3 adenylate cyclase/Tfp pilus assembly protein PilF
MERKLAVIIAVDVVNYSAHMESDESGTFERLRAGRQELFEPEIAKHQGRVFKLMGDGLLAEFGSVVNAVQCAVTLQRGMVERNANVPAEKRLEVRIGINLGEVIVEGDDRYGEGVNVAARLQELAEPGGICVSAKVSKEVERKLAFAFEPMGEHRVKNIAEPIACYRVSPKLDLSPPAHTQRQSAAPRSAGRTGIAVLPFANMSSDPEQDYFADGLAEDLITDLSKISGLMVIARNSSFAYKGKSMDVRSIARDLGVDLIIEGSVRRASGRVRINVQLVSGSDSAHLWAERFDRDLADVFSLQDEVVKKVVEALTAVVPSGRPVARQRATNLEAYDLFVRGRIMVNQSKRANHDAQPLLARSIEIDPDFADAHTWLAMSYHCGSTYWGEPSEPNRSLALKAVHSALTLDPENSRARAIHGDILVFAGKPEMASVEMAKALEFDPNNADAWAFFGCHTAYAGDVGKGIEEIEHAFRLNPHPPGWYYWHLGLIQYAAREFEAAVRTLSHEATHRLASQRILAAALAETGRIDEARAEAKQYLEMEKDFSANKWLARMPFVDEVVRRSFVDGYVKAGLPL